MATTLNRLRKLRFPKLGPNQKLSQLDPVSFLHLFAYLVEIAEPAWGWHPVDLGAGSFNPLRKAMRLMDLSHKCPTRRQLKEPLSHKKKLLSSLDNILSKLEAMHGDELYTKTFPHPSLDPSNAPSRDGKKAKIDAVESKSAPENKIEKPKPKPKKKTRKPIVRTQSPPPPAEGFSEYNIDFEANPFVSTSKLMHSPATPRTKQGIDTDGDIEMTDPSPMIAAKKTIPKHTTKLTKPAKMTGRKRQRDTENDSGNTNDVSPPNAKKRRVIANTPAKQFDAKSNTLQPQPMDLDTPLRPLSDMNKENLRITGPSETVQFNLKVRNEQGLSLSDQHELIKKRAQEKQDRLDTIKSEYEALSRRLVQQYNKKNRPFVDTCDSVYAEFQLNCLKEALHTLDEERLNSAAQQGESSDLSYVSVGSSADWVDDFTNEILGMTSWKDC